MKVVVPDSVRHFKLTRDHRNKPLFKMVGAAESISKNKRRGNQKLVMLIERLDLDRPLILKEKLDVIWNEKKADPIVIRNVSPYKLSSDDHMSIDRLSVKGDDTSFLLTEVKSSIE